MARASDIRAIPQRVLDLYLYPIAGWGIALAVLHVWGHTRFALPLLYALACWQAILTAWWRRDLLRRLERGALTPAEVDAGIRSVGHMLVLSALTPALVFLAADPLSPEALGTSIGNAIVAAVAWGAITVGARVGSTTTYAIALVVACAALPVNATGAVTAATLAGWWSEVIERAPLPELDPGRRPRQRQGSTPGP